MPSVDLSRLVMLIAFRDRKAINSQRRDKILRFFVFFCCFISLLEIGRFLSPHLGTISLLNCRENCKSFKGQHDQGQQDREPLTGKSASERVSERTSENL